MISIDAISAEKDKASFFLKGADAALANAIRRTILEDVPTMAIEDVELRKNSSILYDEMVAHRMGLIPLTTDLKSYNLPAECKCEKQGCASCQAKLTLKAEGPCTVYASDFKSNDPGVKPAYPEMPIAKLLKGQKLEVEATAVLGTGKEHSKWAPGHVYYRRKPVFRPGEVKNPEETVNSYPPGVLELKHGKVVASEAMLLKYDLAGPVGTGTATIDHLDDFVFYLESFGQLGCREILEKAAEIFESKLREFQEIMK